MTDYDDEDEVKIKTELEDSDFAEEYGESATWWYNSYYATNMPQTLHNSIKFST